MHIQAARQHLHARIAASWNNKQSKHRSYALILFNVLLQLLSQQVQSIKPGCLLLALQGLTSLLLPLPLGVFAMHSQVHYLSNKHHRRDCRQQYRE
jgi:hypothetical protein